MTARSRSTIRISGTPKVTIDAAFSKRGEPDRRAGLLTPATGNGTIVTRGWMDPENRNSRLRVRRRPRRARTTACSFTMQAKDAVVAAGVGSA